MPTTIIRIGTKILTRGITDDSILLTRPEEMDGGQLMQAEQRQKDVKEKKTCRKHQNRMMCVHLLSAVITRILSFLSPANVVGEVTKG